jgi:2-iminobutanoate/2-iminopropanoate deaminase
MNHEPVSTDKAPAAIGPYSQAIAAGEFIFVSGQLGIDPTTGSFAGPDAAAQAAQALRNLAAVLEAAGSSLGRVVKTTIFLADMEDFGRVNEVYGSFFTGVKPARSTVQAARLPKDGRVEIEAIARA